MGKGLNYNPNTIKTLISKKKKVLHLLNLCSTRNLLTIVSGYIDKTGSCTNPGSLNLER